MRHFQAALAVLAVVGAFTALTGAFAQNIEEHKRAILSIARDADDHFFSEYQRQHSGELIVSAAAGSAFERAAQYVMKIAFDAAAYCGMVPPDNMSASGSQLLYHFAIVNEPTVESLEAVIPLNEANGTFSLSPAESYAKLIDDLKANGMARMDINFSGGIVSHVVVEKSLMDKDPPGIARLSMLWGILAPRTLRSTNTGLLSYLLTGGSVLEKVGKDLEPYERSCMLDNIVQGICRHDLVNLAEHLDEIYDTCRHVAGELREMENNISGGEF